MNKTIDSQLKHCSIRRFKKKKISTKLLQQFISAGQAAATSSYIQATTLIQVKDSQLREKLVVLTGNQSYVATATEFFVFCADLNRNRRRIKHLNPDADFAWTEQFLAATVDVALFAQNMVIAAESKGLGCCYIGGIRNNPDQVCELLNLPELVYPVFGLCLGYPDQSPSLKPRLPSQVVVHQDQYHWSKQDNDLVNEYDEQIRNYYMERTAGKIDFSWSEQMAKQSMTQTRPFIKDFLHSRGLAKK